MRKVLENKAARFTVAAIASVAAAAIGGAIVGGVVAFLVTDWAFDNYDKVNA